MPRARKPPKPIDRAIVTPVIPQREENDCAVACLAMIACISYEHALRVVCDIDDTKAISGLYITQLIAAAGALGVRLKKQRKFDLESDSGILYLVNGDDRHVVILKGGMVIDTNQNVWSDAEAYCIHYSYEPRLLLVEV